MEGQPVAVDDVLVRSDVRFECLVNTSEVLITKYLWSITSENGGNGWDCTNSTETAKQIVCDASNTCNMSIQCTPYIGTIPGQPGYLDVEVEGDKGILLVVVAYLAHKSLPSE